IQKESKCFTMLLKLIINKSNSHQRSKINMTNYVSDAVNSKVEFQVKHMMVSKVKGSFEEFNFEVETDNLETFEDATVKAEIETASINTGNADRDGHLNSGDLFDAENNPKITFTSNQVEKSAE